jgi:hypothetical protein
VTAEALSVLAAAAHLRDLADVLRVADALKLTLPRPEVEAAAAKVAPSGPAGYAGACLRAPLRWREPLLDGLVTGLEAAAAPRGLLDDDLCELLRDRDWRAGPRTGAAVLCRLAAAGRLDRATATQRIARLLPAESAAPVREAAYLELWAGKDPDEKECHRLLDTLGPDIGSSETLTGIPARFYARASLKGSAVADLARRVVDAGVPGTAADDAEAVLIATRLDEAPEPADAVMAVESLTALRRRASAELVPLLDQVAATSLAKHGPKFRTRVLRDLDETARNRLIFAWLDGRTDRAEQAALVEISIRLSDAGVEVPELDTWAAARVNGWTPLNSLGNRLRGDPELAAGLRRLTHAKRRWSFGRGER